MKHFFLFTTLIALMLNIQAQEHQKSSIAFYNLENLFDTIDAPRSGDFAWTPGGDKIWNSQRYQKKLDNLANVISNLDNNPNQNGPDILGVCEVENRSVLEDLIQTKPISNVNYGIIHYNSPDHRGIDVAMLYQKSSFTVENSQTYTLHFPGEDYHTRDQLIVSGKLHGEKIHIIVNHWPSRRGGPQKSQYRRIAAAKLCQSIADSVKKQNPEANIAILGDFNDDPDNKSIQKILKATENRSQLPQFEYYNPLTTYLTDTTGSLCYRDTWYLFDQILISPALLDNKGLKFQKSFLYNDQHIRVKSGKYKDHPLRTHAGTLYLKGYSDHFPVFITLKKQD